MTDAAARLETLAPSNAVLGANLHALARLSPDAADQIQRCAAHRGVEFFGTEDGSISARLDGRLLASAKRPLDEARAFAQRIDVRESGGVVVTGFGLGRHVEAIAQRAGRSGLVVVFEPDVALLRAVLERIDYSDALRGGNVLIVTDPDDASALSAGLKGLEALIAMGVEMAEHAPSAARIGESAKRFGAMFTRIVASVRTNVVTTMMQTETTVRNALMNVDRYAGRSGIDELQGVCAGLPAVVVSAGPSLERNVRLLAQPGVRERCVIVAVQTALKPLLDVGVRPHFVTALDYHEISRRFYEGLTEDDLRGVTLIAEPKANPSILDAFPGAVRCPRDEFLQIALGEDIAGPHAPIQPGATVAHLAYYFARWLGCDPVALIGQDLGFTDGQYYASGAAIHNVWACELNAFRTLEMMEWERIVRSRSILRVAEDHLGRPVYTDEQMATYLAHFERDFRADAASGLRIVDATEGGVKKAHTSSLTLAQFLALHAHPFSPKLPALPEPAPHEGVRDAARVSSRLREVRAGVWKIGERSREAARLLDEMLEHQQDQSRVNRLIEKVEKVRDEAVKSETAYELVHRFNQTGAFNRARADRSIALEAQLAPMERQRLQIERDARNVRWLAEASDALGAALDDAVRVLGGAPKRTRDESTPMRASHAIAHATARAAAVIPVLFDAHGPDGRTPESAFNGTPALRATLERLARSKRLRRAVLLTDEPERVRAIVGEKIGQLTIEIERVDGAALRARRACVRAARVWAPSCWRGGIGGLTVYDEVLAPDAMSGAMDALGVDGALLLGADWAFIDPALCDAVLERWAEAPERRRVVFTQAPPGLAPCLVDKHVMSELARASERPNVFASIGGLLGYVPVRPKPDPIAQQICVPIPPEVRDRAARFIPDTPARSHALAAVRGDDALSVVRAAGAYSSVRELVIELCASPRTARRRIGAPGSNAPGSVAPGSNAPNTPSARSPMTVERLTSIVRSHVAERGDVVVTFDGEGDALAHPNWRACVAAAHGAGAIGVHLRTDLACDDDPVDALLSCGADAISVDLLAESAATYATLTGSNDFDRVRERLERLLAGRSHDGWLHTPWVVPRMTRCDETYMEVQPFYDRWLLLAGCAALDPLCSPIDGARIAPLALPRSAAERFARERVVVPCDGGER